MRFLALLDAVAAPLVDAALRGALVFLGALVVTSLMRRRSASARHAVWAGAIAIQLLLPLMMAFGPRWAVAAPRALDPWLPAAAPAVAARSTAPSTDGVETSRGERTALPRPTRDEVAATPAGAAAPSTTTPAPSARPSGRTVLLALWALGALCVLARLAVGTAIVAAIARRGSRVDDGGWLSMTQRLASSLHIDRPLTLLRGDRLGVPVTWGIVYPVVLLPEDADAWPEERRRFVLVHEMAHVKRLDALTQLAGQLALALFWFDPLVWIANRRMQLEREHACDDYVLRHGTPAAHYAEELLAMVRAIGTPQHEGARPAFAALAMARRSEFEGRMLSILDPVQDRHPLSRGRTLMGALATLLLVVPLAALRPDHAPPRTVAASAALSAPISAIVQSSPSATSSPNAPSAPSAPDSATPATSSTSPVSPASPASPPTPAATATKQGASCNSYVASYGRSSSHINASDHGDGSGMYSYVGVTGDRCRQASIVGRVTYTPNEDDIASMDPGAHAAFRERTGSDDREVVIRRGGDGGVVHEMRRNGASAPYDESARRWLAGYLPVVLRELGLNVRPRVARLRAEGGVDGVLAAVGAMKSSGAKRSHYHALLEAGGLSDTELDRIVRQASVDLRGSSGDLSSVLKRAAPGLRGASRPSSALEAAIASIPSSGDRSSVLRAYAETANRDLLLSIARLVEGVPSSGDRASLLRGFAPRFLPVGDAALRTAYFRAAATLSSSGDLRSVLNGAPMEYAARSPEIARGVLETARAISSSGDRASVLIRLAEGGALRTSELRELHRRVAEGLSSSDAVRVLQAAARH